MTLQGKAALIIGIDLKNGAHRARSFANQGASFALHYYSAHNLANVQRLGAELRMLCPNSRITFHESDLESANEIKAMFRNVVEHHGEIEYVSTPDGGVTTRPESVPAGSNHHDMFWYRVFLYQQAKATERRHADFLLNISLAG
jgi:NAD(P)-dependent dehydrogenase (short-subunit alcohol dehydrogenase family)